MNILSYLTLSLKSWLKTPVVFALATLMLAVGIGASVAAYGFLNAAFLQPLPVKNPQEMTRIYSSIDRGTMSPGDYYHLVEYNPTFADAFLARVHQGMNFQLGNQAILVAACEVSGNYFEALEVKAHRGRTIRPDDDVAGAAPVVVVSERFWRNQLGSRDDLVGSLIQLNGRPTTVVGIAPASFRGTFRRTTIDVWYPHQQVFPAWQLRHRGTTHYAGLFRLPEGASVAQVHAELDVFAADIEREFPSPGGRPQTFRIRAEQEMELQLQGGLATQSYFILGVLLTLLLIACANVSNLLLAKVNARRNELAVRRALGAPARSIFGLLITDGMVLAAVAGIAGTLFAFLFVRGFSFLGMELPPGEALNVRVLLFFVAVTLVVGFLCSVIPAIQAVRVNINEVLKESARNSTRFKTGGALIAIQVALSLTLLIGSGLFIRSVQEAQQVESGMRMDDVLSFTLNLGNIGGYDAGERIEFYRRLIETLEADPDIDSAGFSTYRLLQGHIGFARMWTSGTDIPDESYQWGVTRFNAGPGFFETMDIPIIAGRAITLEDMVNEEKVAVINETLAKRIWQGENPVGREFIPFSRVPDETLRVIGVSLDFQLAPHEAPPPIFMYPETSNESVVLVHARVDAKRMKPRILAIMRDLEPALPVHDLRTIDESLAKSIQPIRAGFSIMLTVGLLGLAISIIGIYAALSYWVRRSSREIGLRIALGAAPGGIVKMYVRRGTLIVFAGLLLGLALAAFVMPRVQDLLYEVDARDPVTFVAVPVILLLAALLASYFSARHAARVDPMAALRSE